MGRIPEGGPAAGRMMLTSVALVVTLLSCARPEPPSPKDVEERPANRLARGTSPYLLMHAHNPVNWYAWGPEAFAEAKKEGKLVFLSIGYSSCYWCHVMERESFANAEVAKLLNDWFVCIKVDREERPDIDTTYMTALNVLRQRGGWPLSMFLTSDGKPIIGGTYWPREDVKRDGETYGGFKTVLKKIHDLQNEKPEALQNQADRVAELTAQTLAGREHGRALVDLNQQLVAGAIAGLEEEFDPKYGGFGSAERDFRGSKFPTAPYLELWLAELARGQTALLRGKLTLTLDRMAQGGIYDQLGGGFHRYSTERTWMVPHFEKMLYDNAQLAEVYARAYQLTGKPSYRRIVKEILAFVQREMTAPEGGFYSALDAETKGEEGRFYVWTKKEIDDALGNKEDVALVKKVYGAEGGPNFESKFFIFTLPKTLDEVAKDLQITEQQLGSRLKPLQQRLLGARAQRPRPFLDTKILTGWNGQMIAGFAVAGRLLQEPAFTATAVRAADFVLRHLRTGDGRLLRTYGARPGATGEARLNAYVDDYAFLVHGLLALHDATGDKRWLDESQALTETMIRWHLDNDRGGFFLTSSDHEKLFARAKDQYDGAQPSGNSVAARNFVRLWIKTGNDRYRGLAEQTIKSLAGTLKVNPTSLTTLAQALSLVLEAQAKSRPVALAKNDLPVSGGQAKKSDAVVKVTAEAAQPDKEGKQDITVTLNIDKDWHTYANSQAKDFPGIPTAVTVEAATKPEEVTIEYPKGKLVKDEVVGDHSIYEGKVAIKARLRRAKGDTQPLEFIIKIQACNQEKCLLPATVRIKVP